MSDRDKMNYQWGPNYLESNSINYYLKSDQVSTSACQSNDTVTLKIFYNDHLISLEEFIISKDCKDFTHLFPASTIDDATVTAQTIIEITDKATISTESPKTNGNIEIKTTQTFENITVHLDNSLNQRITVNSPTGSQYKLVTYCCIIS